MPWLLTLVRPTERSDLNSNRTTFPSLQLTNFQTMAKSESEAKKAAAVEDDDEPDEW